MHWLIALAISLASWVWASPAQDLFDEAAYRLAMLYGGWSQQRPADLINRFDAQLQQTCQNRPDCPPQEGAAVIEQMLEALGDAHTALYAPQALERFNLIQQAALEWSLGLRVQKADRQEGLVVLEVWPTGPAHGVIAVGERLLSLGTRRLQAPSDLKVTGPQPQTLMVVRNNRLKRVVLKPQELPITPMPYLSWQGLVAHLRIPSFLRSGVGAEVWRLMALAQAQGAQGVVVDLRDNPGGWVSECVQAAGAFAQRVQMKLQQPNASQILEVQNGRYSTAQQSLRLGDSPYAGPVVVLINARSASCAEFFVSLLNQRSSLQVAGEPTYGVGDSSVGLVTLPGGYGLQITQAKVFLANGQPMPKSVVPQVRLSLAPWSGDQDQWLQQAVNWLLQGG